METQEKRKLSKPVLVVLGIILAVYLGGMIYSLLCFLPETSIRGIDVSGMSAEAANDALKGEGLLIDVDQRSKTGRETVTETLDLAEFASAEIEYDTRGLINAQSHLLWFKSFFEPTEFEKVNATGSFDEKSLRLEVCGLHSQRKSTTLAPQDAHLKVIRGKIFVVPEVEGNVVDRELATEKIIEAAEALMRGEGNQRVDLRNLCTEPNVRETDASFIAKKEAFEELGQRKVTINTSSYNSVVLTGSDLINLFSDGENGLEAEESRLADYAQGIADYYYINRYEYLLYDDLFEKLKAALEGGLEEDVTVDASWYINYPTPRTNGNGSASFIEISIGQQYLWYYENGKMILSTPIVTGQAGVSPTPTGYFMVRQRDENARLVGKDYDLTVSYWMGIDNIGYYGIHDAPWRWDFGGNIYTYNGSHGCVNLPYWAAAQLFSRVKINVTEVYIYN